VPRVILRTNGISDPLLPPSLPSSPCQRPCRSRDCPVAPRARGDPRRYPRRRRVFFGCTRAPMRMQTDPNGAETGPERGPNGAQTDPLNVASTIADRFGRAEMVAWRAVLRSSSRQTRVARSTRANFQQSVDRQSRTDFLLAIVRADFNTERGHPFLLLFPCRCASEKSTSPRISIRASLNLR